MNLKLVDTKTIFSMHHSVIKVSSGASFMLFAIAGGFPDLTIRLNIYAGSPGINPEYKIFFGTGVDYRDSDYEFVPTKARLTISAGMAF